MIDITFKKVNFGYQTSKSIFFNLDAKLSSYSENGFVYSIMGGSGIGKTTFLKLLLGTLKPTSGEIIISPPNNRVSYLPQRPIIFEHLSTVENARYFQLIKETKEFFDEELYSSALKILDLKKVINSNTNISNLSGGEIQRISLLRAISINPKLLFLDEPLTGLDFNIKKDFILNLKELIAKKNILVFYVTHHAEEASMIADSILYLTNSDAGLCREIVEYNKSNSVWPHIDLIKTFDPDTFTIFKIVMQKNNEFLFAESPQQVFDYYLAVDNNSFVKSNEGIYEVESLFESNFYYFLRTNLTENIIPIKKNKFNSLFNNFNLNGSALLYDKNSKFIRKVLINNNVLV